MTDPADTARAQELFKVILSHELYANNRDGLVYYFEAALAAIAAALSAARKEGRQENDAVVREARQKTDEYRRVEEASRLDMASALNRAEQAEADLARLRAVIAQVEWIDRLCPWCGGDNFGNHTHKPDCSRQAALKEGP